MLTAFRSASSQSACVLQDINRFLHTKSRPAILAMSRPDAKKNITTLVQAFGENPELRECANLVLIMVRSTSCCHRKSPAAV